MGAGGFGIARLIARREELRGGIRGATLPTAAATGGISGIGQVGGGVGAVRESNVAIPGFTNVQFWPAFLVRVRLVSVSFTGDASWGIGLVGGAVGGVREIG